MSARRAALLAALLLGMACAPARAQEVEAQIVDHGIYTADTQDTLRGPQGIDTSTVVNLCHVDTTRTIPSIDGIQFGFRYRLVGPHAGEIVELRKTVLFPQPLRPPGATQEVPIYEYVYSELVGSVSYTGYGFDHSWEMVRGTWTMQLWNGTRKLVELAFDVVDGAGRAKPQSDNPSCFKISRLGAIRSEVASNGPR